MKCGLYLQLFGIEVLKVLLRQDLVKALEKRLSLFFNPSGQPPLGNKPAAHPSLISLIIVL